MIIIDVGCATYGGDESISGLVAEYKPSLLLGFDPGTRDAIYDLGGTRVEERAAAAWTYDGKINFIIAGIGGHVDRTGAAVPCVDLARVIFEHAGEAIVLKMDAEGAEYTLLPYLVEKDVDLELERALIEFHCADCGVGWITGTDGHRPGCRGDHVSLARKIEKVSSAMRCEIVEWNK